MLTYAWNLESIEHDFAHEVTVLDGATGDAGLVSERAETPPETQKVGLGNPCAGGCCIQLSMATKVVTPFHARHLALFAPRKEL